MNVDQPEDVKVPEAVVDLEVSLLPLRDLMEINKMKTALKA